MVALTILFSLLGAIAQAAPLPMPASMQSEALSARFYGNRPVSYHDIPCWDQGRQGILHDTLCVIADVNINKRVAHDGHFYTNGTPCRMDGQDGTIKDAICVLSDVQLSKRWGNQPYNFGWFHPGPFSQGDQCYQNGQFGLIQDTLCVVADLHISKRGLLGSVFNRPYYGPGHNFGWYHPGPFVNGDRCYQNGQDGIVKNALCIVADIHVAKRWRGGNYYPFGWFHPGPFAEGDKCFQDGRAGHILNSLCVLAGLDLNILKKKDDSTLQYYGEPYFQDGTPFGWFHSGDFANGDVCWQEGNYGSVKDSKCDLVGVDVKVKRGLLDSLNFNEPYYGPGHNFGWYHPGPFVNGDKCTQDGWMGVVKNALCVMVDLNVKRGLLDGAAFRDDPFLGRGVPCTKNGREGILKDTICVVADVSVTKRQEDEQDAEGEEGQEGEMPEQENDQGTEVEVEYEQSPDVTYEKRATIPSFMLENEDMPLSDVFEGETKRGFIFSDGGYSDNFGGADGYDGYYRDAYLRGDPLVDGLSRLDAPGSRYRDPLEGLFRRHHDDLLNSGHGSLVDDALATLKLDGAKPALGALHNGALRRSDESPRGLEALGLGGTGPGLTKGLGGAVDATKLLH